MATGAFRLEQQDSTLIVTPLTDLRESNFLEIEAGASDILRLLGSGSARNVVLDFHKTDYYGSTALGFFVKLWKRVRDCNGRMAFCRLSDHEREILRVTHLDKQWPICASREEALRVVQA